MPANRTIYVTPIDSEGKVRCYTHELEAARRVSQKATSLDREFFCCSKDIDDPERCEFFFWADDLIAGSSQSSNITLRSQDMVFEEASDAMSRKRIPSSYNQSPNSKRSKQEAPSQTQTSKSMPSTPARPSNRKAITPSNPASRALRLSQIRAALAETNDSDAHKDFGQSQPSPTPLFSQGTPVNRQKTPSTPSASGRDKRMTDILRALSSGDNKKRQTHDPDDVFSSSTQVKFKDFVLPRIASHGFAAEPDEDDERSCGLLTPPSSHRPKDSELTGNGYSQTSSRNNGKAKANSFCHESLELPLSQEGVTRPHLRGNNAYSAHEEQALSAESITEVITSLHSIQSYVKNLERKVIGLEKSNSAKAQKIADLQLEIQKLQT